MADQDAGRAVVVLGEDGAVTGMEHRPRYRHDGWTRERQDAFCEALARCGSVVFACRATGLSATSAYKARQRMLFGPVGRGARHHPPQAGGCGVQARGRGMGGAGVQGGCQVGTRRRYSDSLLRMLILRGPTPPDPSTRIDPDEVLNAAFWKKIDAVARRQKAKEREAEIAFADEMVARGLAP